MYKFLRSTDSVLLRMYGLPKIHKHNLPLRPIVSFVGSATYELSKFLKNILSPLVGNTVHTVKNSAEFVELIEKISILDNESQMSFDVVSLFTSIPLETARAIVLDRLSNDCTLEDRTNLTITELTEALDICLTSTYFTYTGNNKCYEQIFGTPMGSSLSPVIANMVMEDLEQQALSTFHNPPSIWVRYVDDVYAIVKTDNVNAFHKHLNTINSSIQFTLEMETSGSIAFLDVLLTRELDGSLSTSIFRKPTHTGRYLPFNSHHPFSQKVSIARTLYSRAEKIINNESNRKSELSKIKDTLQSNGFPTPICSNTFFSKTTQNRNSSNNCATFVSIPYVQGVSEPIKRVLAQVGIETIFYVVVCFS